MEEASILRDSTATRHDPGNVMEDHLIPLPTPSQDFPELLNVALDPFVADERTVAARRLQEMMPGLDMASIHIEV
jgi:hypothetical protein